MNTPLYPNLKFEMARHGDTQISLSKKIGISNSGLSKRLNGKSAFELPEIKKLLEIYNASFEYLFDPDPPECIA